MKDKIFDENYLTELFSCFFNQKINFEMVTSKLKFQNLPNEEYKELYKYLTKQFKLFRKVPSIATSKQKFSENEKICDLLISISEVEVDQIFENTISEFKSFSEQLFLVEKFSEIIEKFNNGKKSDAVKVFEESFKEYEKLNSNNTLQSTRIFRDFSKNNLERSLNTNYTKRMQFGIDALDEALNGGTEGGEFVLFTACSGVGKSHALIHCAISFARQGYNVVYVTAEGTKRQNQDRLDAAWTGTEYHDLKNNKVDEKKKKEIDNILKNHLPEGEIFLYCSERFDTLTFVEIRNIVIERMKTDNVDVVIFDYLELADPGDGVVYNPGSERFRQAKVSRQAKNIAVEFNVPFITATQATDLSPELREDPNFVLTEHFLSEHKGKIRPVDLHITINQTIDEKRQNVCRLWIDKSREHRGKKAIPIVQNLSRSRFYSRKKTIERFLDVDDDFREKIEKMMNDEDRCY